jgi:hypothetical protein
VGEGGADKGKMPLGRLKAPNWHESHVVVLMHHMIAM